MISKSHFLPIHAYGWTQHDLGRVSLANEIDHGGATIIVELVRTALVRGAKPGDNFIYVFTRSFYTHRSQKRKKLLNLTAFLALLGCAFVKAARKMLVKLTPDFCASLVDVGIVRLARVQPEVNQIKFNKKNKL